MYVVYNIVYVYLVWHIPMTQSLTMKMKKAQQEQQPHDVIQKQILKKILEQGCSCKQLELENIHHGEEIVYTLKKSFLSDLTDKELFTVAQTFVDISAPITIAGEEQSFNFQEDLWQQYLAENEEFSRESNYVALQSRVMDRIAKYLYGVDSYDELLV